MFHSPFTDEFVKGEGKWYGLSEYDKDGIVIKSRPITGRCDDFLNVNMRIDETLVCPTMWIDGTVWMSLTPMEVESQWRAIKHASGVVHVLGIGMGYTALRIAEKDDVVSVTLYEQDERVIRFFKENFATRKGFDKINIVEGDARETFNGQTCDYAFVDIYPSLGDDEMLEELKSLQEAWL